MTIDFLRILRLLGLVVVCLMGSMSSYAQDASDDDFDDDEHDEHEVEDSDDFDVEALLQRLQAAEQRISQIEEGDRKPSIFSEDDLASDPSVFDDRIRRNSNIFSDDGLASDRTIFEDRNRSKSDEPKGSLGGNQAKTRPTVSVFGRVHLEALDFARDSPGIGYFENPITGADPENRIQFRRIRLGAQGTLLNNGIYRLEFDLGNPSRSNYRDVYVGFEHLPFFQTVLIGNQKRPLGLDTWNSNQHVLFLERPLALNAFNPNFRRIGIQSYGHTEDDQWNWQVGIFEVQDIKEFGHYIGDATQLSYNTRFTGTPWYDEVSGGRGYLHLGVSNMFATTDANAGPLSSDANQSRFSVRPELQTSSSWLDTGRIMGGQSFNVTGLESVLNVGSLHVTGEYMTTVVDRQNNSNLNFQGGYVQAAYFLTGEHEAWDREAGRLLRPKPFEKFFLVSKGNGDIGRGWGAWQVAARWSTLSLNDKDIHGGSQDNWTLGLNWYWTPYSKVVFNMVDGHIRDRAPVGGFTDGHFTAFGTRLMIDF